MGSDGGSSPSPFLAALSLAFLAPPPPPPPFTGGRARLQCQWKRPIGVFTGNKEIPFRIERRSNELGEGGDRGKQKQVGKGELLLPPLFILVERMKDISLFLPFYPRK